MCANPFNKNNITTALIESVKKHLTVRHYRIFYFGSRVAGNPMPYSDLDVGIDADTPIPSFQKLEIQSEMDNLPVMQKIEVIDFASVDDTFKKVALKNIEVIYER